LLAAPFYLPILAAETFVSRIDAVVDPRMFPGHTNTSHGLLG
jgi:hypothetical protein